MEQTILTTFKPGEFEALIDNSIAKVLQAELSKIENIQKPVKTIFTRQETASLLDISLPTLNEYTKRGIIVAYRLGYKVRYRLNDIEQALIKIKSR